MNARRAHLARAAAVAAGLGRLAAGGAYTAYVRPGMRIPLLISAAVLFVLALANAWFAPEPHAGHDHGSGHGSGHGDDGHDHGHDHGAFPWVGALLVIPIVCIAIVPILPLGSGAVTERRANVLAADAATSVAPDQPLGPGELTLLDFMTRVVTLPDRPFTEPVTVTGFVASTDRQAGDFVLGRFVMSCCAADAQPVLVTVRTDGPIPKEDRWVEVTGVQVPAPAGLTDAERSDPANVILDATEVRPIEQPAHPYLNA